MTAKEKSVIKSMDKCDFTLIHQHYVDCSEERKKMSSQEKLRLKEEVLEQYGWCWIDGQKERVGNYKIEPPGLFRGRGDHPKQGRIKVGVACAVWHDRSDIIMDWLCYRNVSSLKMWSSISEGICSHTKMHSWTNTCMDKHMHGQTHAHMYVYTHCHACTYRNAKVPSLPQGQEWKEVKHDTKVPPSCHISYSTLTSQGDMACKLDRYPGIY